MTDYFEPKNLNLIVRAANRIPDAANQTTATRMIKRVLQARQEEKAALRTWYMSETAAPAPNHMSRRTLLRLAATVHFIERTLDQTPSAYRLLWKMQDAYAPVMDDRRFLLPYTTLMSETLGYAGLP